MSLEQPSRFLAWSHFKGGETAVEAWDDKKKPSVPKWLRTGRGALPEAPRLIDGVSWQATLSRSCVRIDVSSLKAHTHPDLFEIC